MILILASFMRLGTVLGLWYCYFYYEFSDCYKATLKVVTEKNDDDHCKY